MRTFSPRSTIFASVASFSALLVLTMPAVVRAQQPVLTADTFVSSSNTTTNYGPSTTLNVSGTSAALFKFDLVNVLPTGTTAAQVVRARFIVFPDKVTTPGIIDLYQLTSVWTEATVTYLNRPGRGASPLTTQNASTANSYLNFPVTGLVQGWITNPSSNFGIELRCDGSGYITVDSKENPSTSHPAVLQIDLAGPVGPAGPAGAKGSTGPAGPKGSTGPTGPSGTLSLPYAATVDGGGAALFSVTNAGNSGGRGIVATGAVGPNQGGSGIHGVGGGSFATFIIAQGGSGVEGSGGNGSGVTIGGYGGSFLEARTEELALLSSLGIVAVPRHCSAGM